ncbi:MAG: phage portal protein [Candidatus Xenobiia bacterium LiM19]
MGFWRNLKSLFWTEKASPQPQQQSAQAYQIPHQSAPPRRRGAEWLRMYSSHPWLRSSASRYATALAKQFPALMDGGKDPAVEVRDHEALQRLKRPNPYMTYTDLVKLYAVYLRMIGESFWIVERSISGNVLELWPVPPHWVTETPFIGKPYFSVTIYGQPYAIPESEILWKRDPDPYDPYGRGTGAFQAVGDEIETDDMAAAYNKQFYWNSAKPEIVISVPGNIDGNKAREYEEKWAAKYQGFWNVFKPAVLANGATVKELNRTHEEMSFIEGRNQMRDTIVIGGGMMPLSILGIVEDANRANMEAAEDSWAKWEIDPMYAELAEFLDVRYLPLFKKTERLYFYYPSTQIGNRERILKEANAEMDRGAITVDEYRKKLGDDPLPDGMGQIYLVPNSKTVVREFIPSAPVMPSKTQGKAIITKDDDKRQAPPLDIPAWDQEAIKIFRPVLTQAFTDAAEAVAAEFGFTFDLTNPNVAGFLKDHIDEHFHGTLGINQTASNLLSESLNQGYEAGEGVSELLQRVEDVYDQYITDDAKPMSGFRAENIARTESNRAANMGNLEAYDQAGLTEKWWLVTHDERTRETHLAAGEKYGEDHPIPIRQDFEVGGATGPAPGAMSTAKESCQCRCRAMAVVGKKVMAEDELTRLGDIWCKKLEPHEKKLRDELTRYFRRQKAEVKRILRGD